MEQKSSVYMKGEDDRWFNLQALVGVSGSKRAVMNYLMPLLHFLKKYGSGEL